MMPEECACPPSGRMPDATEGQLWDGQRAAGVRWFPGWDRNKQPEDSYEIGCKPDRYVGGDD